MIANKIFDMACAMNKAKAEELRSEHKADGFSALGVSDDIGPTIAKIPLRAEVRQMNQFADLCESSARMYDEESEHLRRLAKDAREAANNLTKVADL